MFPNSDKDRARLVKNLERRGIRFLASDGTADEAENDLSTDELLTRLARSPDPRLRLSLIPFFILHPQTASKVPELVETLDEPTRVELMTFYMAAVYLQRFWKPRLGLYLEDFPELPDLYSQTLSLPRADERYGKTGLYALADWQASRSPFPFNWLASYQKFIDLLIEQLKLETRHKIRHNYLEKQNEPTRIRQLSAD
jgi:hypothetical protein